MLNSIKSIATRWQNFVKLLVSDSTKIEFVIRMIPIQKVVGQHQSAIWFFTQVSSLWRVLVNGSTILDKQLADVILDLDQVRHSMGRRGRKSGKPSERLQGETDLAHPQCFKYLGLARNNINRIDVIFNGFSKKTKQPSSNKL